MPAANWRSPDEYSYLNELTGPELAWEFLRRNPEYIRDCRRLLRIMGTAVLPLRLLRGDGDLPLLAALRTLFPDKPSQSWLVPKWLLPQSGPSLTSKASLPLTRAATDNVGGCVSVPWRLPPQQLPALYPWFGYVSQLVVLR